MGLSLSIRPICHPTRGSDALLSKRRTKLQFLSSTRFS